jgi:hypothetical protein
MRAAVAQRNAQALRIPDDDVGAHFARRDDERQAQKVGRDRHQHVRAMCGRNEATEFEKGAMVVGRLHEGTVNVRPETGIRWVTHRDNEAEWLGAASKHVESLRKGPF